MVPHHPDNKQTTNKQTMTINELPTNSLGHPIGKLADLINAEADTYPARAPEPAEHAITLPDPELDELAQLADLALDAFDAGHEPDLSELVLSAQLDLLAEGIA